MPRNDSDKIMVKNQALRLEELIVRQIDFWELHELALAAKDQLWADAASYNRNPKIYLHWSGMHYDQKFDDYHINIDGNGGIWVSTDDLSEVLSHTYCRNTGAIGVSMDCCYNGTTNDLGDEPPTEAQIEQMARIISVLSTDLDIPIDIENVMTHGEAADNVDGLYPHEQYGPQSGAMERWDLQYLGTSESSYYTTDYDDPVTGGNILRGKAQWYSDMYNGKGGVACCFDAMGNLLKD